MKDNKVRISLKSVNALRTKLGLSQNEFAKLLRVTGQAVYVMERKVGRLRLCTPTMTTFLTLREIGILEAAKMIVEKHLLTIAFFDKATVERLIAQEEEEKQPNASRLELMKLAIKRYERDNK